MPPKAPADRLSVRAAAAIRAAIRMAGGNEVCFACTLDDDGVIAAARVVARGDVGSVLALPGFAQRGEMLVHNHPSGVLEPSHADMAVAARVHDEGIGFGIVDNDATTLYVVVEVDTRKQQSLDPAAIAHDLGPDGPVAGRHARYEDRASQRAMAAAIAKLYNRGGVGLLEAGTGVGKSLGYLVPALRWAAANGERTVVSTNTINLQEQLVGKDLPFLAQALTDQKVRFAMLKGWRNYLCLMRLEQARTGGAALFEDTIRTDVEGLAEWAERTKDGSLSDLPAAPRGEVWDEVAAEPDLCGRFKCRHYDKCFVFKARKAAAQADVIVVNHHLLLSDVAVRRATGNWQEAAVLPSYARLVIDEGHHLEDAAAAHLGSTATKRGVARLVGRLERRGNKGLLPALVEKLGANTKDLLSAACMDFVMQELQPNVRALREKSEVLFDLLETVLREADQPILRLTDDFATHRAWDAGLRVALDDTIDQLALIDKGLTRVRDMMEASPTLDEAMAPLMNEARAVSRRLQSTGDALRAALQPPKGARTVRWIEVRGKDRAVALAAVPLDLAPILREDLFARLRTTVVTSATLATGAEDPESNEGGDPFAFLAQRLGLDTEELEPVTAQFASPFDYEEQALLAIPTDAPVPNADAPGHFRHVGRIVVDVAAAADGGMFVLFTSHRDVRQMASELRARGFERRWPLLVHGEDARDTLLARFRDNGRAVLLGTASFWEGVDVPGDALRALVIAKLPFRVPTEPVTAAQCEAIAARGGDAFTEYMLPHAALRLKQGFGRLIRSATDRGAVVIADPRLVLKPYGRELLRGLPPAARAIGPWAELLPRVQGVYGKHVTPAPPPVIPNPTTVSPNPTTVIPNPTTVIPSEARDLPSMPVAGHVVRTADPSSLRSSG